MAELVIIRAACDLVETMRLDTVLACSGSEIRPCLAQRYSLILPNNRTVIVALFQRALASCL